MPYLQVTWVTEAPAAQQMGWGNTVFLASGNTPSQCVNPQIVTPSSYTSYLSSTSLEYKAYESFNRNFPGTPSNTTYVYWLGGGSGITGIATKVSDIQYNLTLPPYKTIDKVYVDPTGGSNWQEIAKAGNIDFSVGISGYWPATGVTGVYNGYIDFTGQALHGGPYFNYIGTGDDGALFSGNAMSGTNARNVMTASGGHIRIYATTDGFGAAQSNLKNYDIQIVVPIYDVAGNGTGLQNTPAFNDLMNALGMAAGTRRIVVWPLPSGAKPNVDYHGTNQDYNQFRNYVGQDQNAIVIQADVTRAANGTGIDNPAAALAGRIAAQHPHTPLTLDTITMSLTRVADANEKAAWDAGHIICVFRQTELGFTADQLNYGFTFAGTSPSNRIENVRCKYLVEYNVLADLWTLLSGRTVRINKAGCNKVINTIHATLNRLLNQGIIDEDEGAVKRIVDIPLLRGTAAEWSSANLTRVIPSIIIRWPWKNTVETLIITQFGEII